MVLREPFDQLAIPPTTWTQDLKFPSPDKLRIQDTTLRDGEQTPGVIFTPTQKFEIACALSDLGVHILDLGFPAVGKAEHQTLKLAIDAKRSGRLRRDMELLVVCRSLLEDISTTRSSLELAGIAPDEISLFIFTAGSDLHIKYKLGKMLLRREGKKESEWLDTPVEWYREINKQMFTEAIVYARQCGFGIIEAGNAEDGSRADLDYIIDLGNAAFKAGATRQAFPDTVGVFTPEAVRHYISGIVGAFPARDLVVHFHNDFDMATVNTITAMSLGANIATVTLCGLGERAGNAPLHSVLAALKMLYGVTIPGIQYDKIVEATLLASRLSGIPIQPNEPIVGANVYAHESGIHTAGIVVEPRMYQVIDASEFGGKTRFVFGKHSGNAIVKHVMKLHESELAAVGVTIDDELVHRVLEEVKTLRERQAALHNTETLVDSIYEKMNQLGVSEKDVVELAKLLGKDRGFTAASFW
jgi:isopropylmalate/homocitrate/citramalate synthase